MNPCREGEALIHDAQSKSWLHFQNPLTTYSAYRQEEVGPLILRIHREVKEKRLYAAGFIAYDAAPGMDDALHSQRDKETPLLSFTLYPTPTILDKNFLIPSQDPSQGEGKGPDWKATMTRSEYNRGIMAVKEYIRQGQTYQVNYTYRLKADFTEDPWEFFCRIRTAQKAPYGAYLSLGKWTVCSASPELFFSLDGDRISTKPMKGTAPRGLTLGEDKKKSRELLNSEKNRAENMMIVDMIRNDLGRIARTGSVRVPRLFNLEKYPTLWQMTSEILAETDAEIPEIMNNLFPCASITGAPKYRTMEIIRELENTPRGLYTGSIGYWGPDRKAQFNVAIRTALIDNSRKKAFYGTGGGIVWDSTAEGEYAESLNKIQILTRKMPDFSLLETLKWSPSEGYSLLDRHLDRMEESAEYFDRPFSRERVKTKLIRESSLFYEPGNRRVRLLLDSRGEVQIETAPLPPAEAGPQAWTIKSAKTPIDHKNPLVYHKTTRREFYKEFRAQWPEADDVLLWNEKREVCETTVCNIIAVWGGDSFTPPRTSGLLGGTLRREMLESGEIKERVITLDELVTADEIYLINSVRGRIKARWDKGDHV
ncbi:aminodeoxychorismate synthase component I [Oceanispirochaeta sp.]|jgi:para-aminobenzoate synthetase/4-amino-4-deoxychorismate lyase|uniref:aminodeoxychorismate synthase component I n=1 Tax=Oceanispirochaeta sp. TaxID=2035350 RepID=UPI0026119D7F|nr:aminodeoxychorismate synthase component I [Oceanispirochaeta sp.]MDA3957599.1 aminodeoxychorismate synthase component I [Oceanispirochaeta sp.]